MGKRLIPTAALDLQPAANLEAEILPLTKAVLALIRAGSQRRIMMEANDLTRYLMSDDGFALGRQRPATYGAVSFAIKLLTAHASDTAPAKTPGRGASLAVLAPAVGGRARVDDDAE